jgi:hypothetical protein
MATTPSDPASAPRSAGPIIVTGQLTLRTIRGRNGPFNVARLATPIGEFVVKDAELEQYPEGKYDGQFVIRYIYPKAYPTGGGMRFEIRANLDGMTLSGLDKLSKEDARKLGTQEVDPLDEEQSQAAVATPSPAPAVTVTVTAGKAAPVRKSKDPLIDTTPFGVTPPPAASGEPDAAAGENEDAALFGLLWPLGESVRLDSTIDRRVLRTQTARLGALGYQFDFKSQQWHRKPD